MNQINRREFIHKLGAGTCAAALLPGLKGVNESESNEKRPNFIFIFADDMGWGDMPCYGHRHRAMDPHKDPLPTLSSQKW